MGFKSIKATKEREKTAGLHTSNPNDIGMDTVFAISMIKKYKLMQEYQFKLQRSQGEYGDTAESGVSISDKMAHFKKATIGVGTDEHTSMLNMNTEMRARVRALEETQATILDKV